jgi:hypothetical protein
MGTIKESAARLFHQLCNTATNLDRPERAADRDPKQLLLAATLNASVCKADTPSISYSFASRSTAKKP